MTESRKLQDNDASQPVRSEHSKEKRPTNNSDLLASDASNGSRYYLTMENLTYKRDTFTLFNNISFSVIPEEFLMVVGSDIGGKTSLLKLCAGLIQPNEGIIKINGKPLNDFSYDELRRFRRKTGFVFQDAVLISNLTVKENVALPLRYHSELNDATIDKCVAKYLEPLNLMMYADERPAGLSIEIKLLVNLARALVIEPDLLLLDELFSSLSKTDVITVINLLKETKNTRRFTCLATTKMVNLISSFPEEPLVDCLMVIENGRIIKYGLCKVVRENILSQQN